MDTENETGVETTESDSGFWGGAKYVGVGVGGAAVGVGVAALVGRKGRKEEKAAAEKGQAAIEAAKASTAAADYGAVLGVESLKAASDALYGKVGVLEDIVEDHAVRICRLEQATAGEGRHRAEAKAEVKKVAGQKTPDNG